MGGEVADWYRQTPELEYVDEADREAVRASAETLLAVGQSSLHYRVQRKKGEVRWIRDDRQLVRNAGDVPVEIVGSWTDVTDHRLLEEQYCAARGKMWKSVGQLAVAAWPPGDFNNVAHGHPGLRGVAA